MDTPIDKLKRGETVRRLITYLGVRVWEQFQPNKDYPGTFDRYYLPSNRDKSQAVQQNYALELSEVEKILSKSNTE
jgi:hypothetical protein